VETLTTKMGTDEGCRSRKIKWKINFPDFSASLLFFFFILLLFFWGGFTCYVNRARIVRVSERGTRARKKNDRNSGPPLRAGLIDSRLF
jgi:hypothetical protein